jgi:hypothetical protein
VACRKKEKEKQLHFLETTLGLVLGILMQIAIAMERRYVDGRA